MTIQELKTKWLGQYFYNDNIDLYRVLENDFADTLRTILEPVRGRVTKHIRGHFYCSFFIRRADEKCICIGIPDVRYVQDGWATHILYREAKDENDYYGGMNHYANIDNLIDGIRRL